MKEKLHMYVKLSVTHSDIVSFTILISQTDQRIYTLHQLSAFQHHKTNLMNSSGIHKMLAELAVKSMDWRGSQATYRLHNTQGRQRDRSVSH